MRLMLSHIEVPNAEDKVEGIQIARHRNEPSAVEEHEEGDDHSDRERLGVPGRRPGDTTTPRTHSTMTGGAIRHNQRIL